MTPERLKLLHDHVLHTFSDSFFSVHALVNVLVSRNELSGAQARERVDEAVRFATHVTDL